MRQPGQGDTQPALLHVPPDRGAAGTPTFFPVSDAKGCCRRPGGPQHPFASRNPCRASHCPPAGTAGGEPAASAEGGRRRRRRRDSRRQAAWTAAEGGGQGEASSGMDAAAFLIMAVRSTWAPARRRKTKAKAVLRFGRDLPTPVGTPRASRWTPSGGQRRVQSSVRGDGFDRGWGRGTSGGGGEAPTPLRAAKAAFSRGSVISRRQRSLRLSRQPLAFTRPVSPVVP
jgi:hypothetical protein